MSFIQQNEIFRTSQGFVHHRLEGGSGIGQARVQHLGLIAARRSQESRSGSILLRDQDSMTSRCQIKARN